MQSCLKQPLSLCIPLSLALLLTHFRSSCDPNLPEVVVYSLPVVVVARVAQVVVVRDFDNNEQLAL